MGLRQSYPKLSQVKSHLYLELCTMTDSRKHSCHIRCHRVNYNFSPLMNSHSCAHSCAREKPMQGMTFICKNSSLAQCKKVGQKNVYTHNSSLAGASFLLFRFVNGYASQLLAPLGFHATTTEGIRFIFLNLTFSIFIYIASLQMNAKPNCCVIQAYTRHKTFYDIELLSLSKAT